MSYRRPVTSACFLLLLSACGGGADADDQGPVTPPDNPARELPTVGGPPADAEFVEPDISYREPDFGNAADLGDPEPVCCEVRFAIPDRDGNENEVSGVLRGSRRPLRTADGEGIPVRYANGQWGATVCVPPGFDGTYYYEFALPSSTEGVYFMDRRVNPYVETTDDGGELVNVFEPADSCDQLDASVHSKLSE
jgi:hypothetical protein